MPVLEPPGRPFSDVSHVGLVIRKTNFGFHTGFLYKIGEDEPRMLHLAFHHDLRDELAKASYRWVQVNLDDLNKPVLAALLARIAVVNPDINYGFDSQGACFTSDGNLLKPFDIGKGMTCATFITATLRKFGYEVVDLNSWPDREEDRQWEEMILGELKRFATDAHIDALRADVGAKRLKPNEITGAVTITDLEWPLNYDQVLAVAQQVVDDLS